MYVGERKRYGRTSYWVRNRYDTLKGKELVYRERRGLSVSVKRHTKESVDCTNSINGVKTLTRYVDRPKGQFSYFNKVSRDTRRLWNTLLKQSVILSHHKFCVVERRIFRLKVMHNSKYLRLLDYSFLRTHVHLKSSLFLM